jgi:hypothetical protein
MHKDVSWITARRRHSFDGLQIVDQDPEHAHNMPPCTVYYYTANASRLYNDALQQVLCNGVSLNIVSTHKPLSTVYREAVPQAPGSWVRPAESCVVSQ